MSKIGKLPISIEEGVKVEIKGSDVMVTGPKGSLKVKLPHQLKIENKDNRLELNRKDNQKLSVALHGTFRSLINNMMIGVTKGWQKQLEMVGTGYRPQLSGDVLTLLVGYSHPVEVKAPEGIKFVVEKNVITIDGADKESVGQIAAKIRAIRPPEPYKGKGIKYIDEVIRRKAGKAAKTQGAA